MSALEYKERVEISAPPKNVWKAITDPSIASEYYLAPLKTIELRVHGRIIYGTDDYDMIAGKVIEIIPYKLLSHTFMFDTPSHRGPKVDAETIVTYDITEKDGGSVLTLTHTGFEERNQTYANITGGWPMILNHMKVLLEKAPEK